MPPSCSFKARPRQLSDATPFGDDPSLQLLRHTDLHSFRGRRLEISPKGDIGGRQTQEERKYRKGLKDSVHCTSCEREDRVG